MKRTLIIVAFVLLTLTGCSTTRYIQPSLPTVSFTRPERPELLTVEAEVPVEATVNLIRLTGYAEKLEIVLDAWETYYNAIAKGENNEQLDNNRN